MREFKEYLNNKLHLFFEAASEILNGIIASPDTRKGFVFKIDPELGNFYDKADPEDVTEFNNPDGFIDGYMVEQIPDKKNKLILVQKLNLTKISKNIGLSLDETQKEIAGDVSIDPQRVNSYINKTPYFLHVLGEDYEKYEGSQGFYKLSKVISEDVETKGDVYLVLKLELALSESTALPTEKIGRVNIKGSKSLKIGKAKEKLMAGEEEEEEEEELPIVTNFIENFQ
ncbi:MAG: hypothetical protein QXG00_07200 [Candidatus Woesearchaeota archaeon]